MFALCLIPYTYETEDYMCNTHSIYMHVHMYAEVFMLQLYMDNVYV